MKRISSVYFFPFLNTYKFQYWGRFGGKTVLRCTYLFRRVHFLDSFLLWGSGISLESGGKAPVIFGSKILFCSFPGILATVSTHLVTPTAVFSRARPGSLATIQHISSRRLLSKNSILFAGKRAWSFWHQISTSFHGD